MLVTLEDEADFAAASEADSLQWRRLDGGSEEDTTVQTDLDFRLRATRCDRVAQIMHDDRPGLIGHDACQDDPSTVPDSMSMQAHRGRFAGTRALAVSWCFLPAFAARQLQSG